MKFEHTQVFNFDGALRGMRNPLESWSKSDSDYEEVNHPDTRVTFAGRYLIGENDLKLAQKLIKAGTDHSKFLRQILVSVDITAPLYWWKEFDTYKVGTVANSTSTMHKLDSTKITPECFAFDSVPEDIQELMCDILETHRILYQKTKSKETWKTLIQLLPSSWLQTRTITMSYQNIRAMYFARRNHKLTEWSNNFINWVISLPYAKELITVS